MDVWSNDPSCFRSRHRIRERALAVALLLAVCFLAFPALAHAYPTDDGPFDCDQCHSITSDGSTSTWEGTGPHGHYSTTTRKCATCHSVHTAPASSLKLLSAATVSASCLNCHDGTGGIGPYHSIEARGGTVAAEHSVEMTTVVPGGTDELGSPLSCGSCHAVHGGNTVEPFLRDSGRAFEPDAYVESDCLLRSGLGDAPAGTYPVYGAQWCAGCHDQRHSESVMAINHPVDSDPLWGYGDVVTSVTDESWRLDADDPFATGMGRTNAAYIMAPVAVAGDGRVEVRRDPMCQQCHEDARNVSEIFQGDYTGRGVTDPLDPSYEPWLAPINPVFLTFPHQTTNQHMLVEARDDLCLNCHVDMP